MSSNSLSAVSQAQRSIDNVLDNEHLTVDFTPLYQCIHIYTALDALDEIRKSYQADRKVRVKLLPQSSAPEAYCRHNQTL